MTLKVPVPKVGTLSQTGHSCGEYHRCGIQDLCKFLSLNWDGTTLKQNFRIQGKVRPSPTNSATTHYTHGSDTGEIDRGLELT